MTLSYYVSQTSRTDGNHEVHKFGCRSIPEPRRRLYLGDFSDCRQAISEARRHYAQVDACELCARPCVTHRIQPPI